jgi:hypothetical protein
MNASNIDLNVSFMTGQGTGETRESATGNWRRGHIP